MANNHIQVGDVMPWTNGTGSAVASGDVVVVSDQVCIALEDIADGDSGQLAVEEVWEVPKAASLAIAQGDKLYWSAANGSMSKTDTDTYAGRAFAAAASADTTVNINLGVV